MCLFDKYNFNNHIFEVFIRYERFDSSGFKGNYTK